MTDKEIIKAAQHCANGCHCGDGCPGAFERCTLELANFITEKAAFYGWHKRPEKGWTEETLPLRNREVLYKYHYNGKEEKYTGAANSKDLREGVESETVWTVDGWAYFPEMEET